MKHNSHPSPEICFIGSNSVFSFTALKTLCENGISISQVILAGHSPAKPPARLLPVTLEQESFSQNHLFEKLSAHYNIPVTFLGYTKNCIQQWQHICGDNNNPTPDYIFVACFPERLPTGVINWPHQEIINLHPSLLPKYRGPDPIFWQLRHNEPHTGISLHLISCELDAGPLLHQQHVAYPPGASRTELNTLLAQHGAKAFTKILSTGNFRYVQQDESLSSYHPFPGMSDYETKASWSAEHVKNFICGNDLLCER